jgi:hypothetical protein
MQALSCDALSWIFAGFSSTMLLRRKAKDNVSAPPLPLLLACDWPPPLSTRSANNFKAAAWTFLLIGAGRRSRFLPLLEPFVILPRLNVVRGGPLLNLGGEHLQLGFALWHLVVGRLH